MESVAYINNTTTVVFPRTKRLRKVVNEVPEGYMSLEAFGELFHQKLDEAYAKLQSDSEQ